MKKTRRSSGVISRLKAFLDLCSGAQVHKFVTLLFAALSEIRNELLLMRFGKTRDVQTWLPNILSKLKAALINARCVKACGKLPSASPCGPVCSE
jgi:hypothetical protein